MADSPSPMYTSRAVSIKMIMIRIEALLARVEYLESTLFSRDEYYAAMTDIVVEKQMLVMSIRRLLMPGRQYAGDDMLREILGALEPG
jgi:hypothetical protein